MLLLIQSSRCGANLLTELSSIVKSAPLTSALQSPSYSKIPIWARSSFAEIKFSTYNVDDEAWFAGERSMLKVGLDVFWNEIFSSAKEFDSSVVFGTKWSVVLLNTVATSTPIQMQVDNWNQNKRNVSIFSLVDFKAIYSLVVSFSHSWLPIS